jgi:hypothetical protein
MRPRERSALEDRPVTYAYYYVLTAEAAIAVGVINDKWEEILAHDATERAILKVAMSRHRSYEAAELFALESGEDTWVLAPDGKAHWVPQ